MTQSTGHWIRRVEDLAPAFAARAAQHDADDSFVGDNYQALKENRLFSAMAPAELGGGGARYGEMCEVITLIGRHCPSTALAFSMHQHLIATLRWNFAHGRPGEKPLRAVAEKELVLVSTGAGDWLASRGTAERVDGGYLVTARKIFGSGGPAGNLLVTSVPYRDPDAGWQVLHCPVPMSAEGVSIENDWAAMGMRGTGSGTIVLNRVFVPEGAVVLTRPRGEYHPFWDVVLTVALPLIMSAYVGLAQQAYAIAVRQATKLGDDGVRPALLGAARNQLTIAELAHADMVANAAEFAFEPETARADRALVRKTLVANAVKSTVDTCIEAVGGAAYYRSLGLERLLRDSYAGSFHPMPEARQQAFTGRLAMGLSPASDMGWKQEVPMAAE